MPLFGPPNVDRHRKKGHIGKLVGLLTYKDADIASSALTALQQIANDKELERYRKQSWALYIYEHVIKKIEKLNKEQRASIEQLFQKLITEKHEIEKKNAAAKRGSDELKKRFEDSFKSLSGATDDFFNDLWSILSENKEFLFTKKFPGKYVGSPFPGVIVTKDEILYFHLHLRWHRVAAVRFNEINEFKFGMLKSSIKIKDQKGTWMKIPLGGDDYRMVAFIEDNLSLINGG